MENADTFKIGDYVTFIDDVMSGKIIQIEKDQITIESEEGFIYHCQSGEIIHRKDLSKMIDDHTLINKERNEKSKKSIKKTKEIPFIEIDLHIHNLIDSTKGLTNFEIVTLQLNKAQETLRYAIGNNIRRVIFIHGVGQGVLKKELRKMLQKYPVEISEANYHKYGLGATEAYIFQNYKEL